MRRVISIALTALIAAAGAIMSFFWLRAEPTPTCPHGARGPTTTTVMQEPVTTLALRGLWSRYPDAGGKEDAPVAFYYFHDGGIGLYRYGRLGHNTTNSYDWVTTGDGDNGGMLVLSYRKTGAVQHSRVRIERDGSGRRALVVENDPKNPGQPTSRYVYVPPPSFTAQAPDLALDALTGAFAVGVDDRLWIDQLPFKTGGMGFSLYQLRKAGIDGRGTGWHHVGDYDDWSTEALSYRLLRGDSGPNGIDLVFSLRQERHTTALRLDGTGKNRTLTLASDPRDFWAAHTFKDGGPSFAGLLAQRR